MASLPAKNGLLLLVKQLVLVELVLELLLRWRGRGLVDALPFMLVNGLLLLLLLLVLCFVR